MYNRIDRIHTVWHYLSHSNTSQTFQHAVFIRVYVIVLNPSFVILFHFIGSSIDGVCELKTYLGTNMAILLFSNSMGIGI